MKPRKGGARKLSRTATRTRREREASGAVSPPVVGCADPRLVTGREAGARRRSLGWSSRDRRRVRRRSSSPFRRASDAARSAEPAGFGATQSRPGHQHPVVIQERVRSPPQTSGQPVCLPIPFAGHARENPSARIRSRSSLPRSIPLLRRGSRSSFGTPPKYSPSSRTVAWGCSSSWGSASNGVPPLGPTDTKSRIPPLTIST